MISKLDMNNFNSVPVFGVVFIFNLNRNSVGAAGDDGYRLIWDRIG